MSDPGSIQSLESFLDSFQQELNSNPQYSRTLRRVKEEGGNMESNSEEENFDPTMDDALNTPPTLGAVGGAVGGGAIPRRPEFTPPRTPALQTQGSQVPPVSQANNFNLPRLVAQQDAGRQRSGTSAGATSSNINNLNAVAILKGLRNFIEVGTTSHPDYPGVKFEPSSEEFLRSIESKTPFGEFWNVFGRFTVIETTTFGTCLIHCRSWISQGLTWSQFKNKFLNLYADDDLDVKSLQKILNARREKGETVKSFAARISSYVVEIESRYPTMKEEARFTANSVFLNQLPTKVAARFRNRGYFVDWIKDLGSYLLRETQFKLDPESVAKEKIGQVTVVSRDGYSDREVSQVNMVNRGRGRNRRFLREVPREAAHHRTFQPRRGGGHAHRGGGNRRERRSEVTNNATGSNLQCYNCQEYGHTQANCPHAFMGVCYQCNAAGHMARNCRKRFQAAKVPQRRTPNYQSRRNEAQNRQVLRYPPTREYGQWDSPRIYAVEQHSFEEDEEKKNFHGRRK